MILSHGTEPVMLDDKRMQQPPKTKRFPPAKHDFFVIDVPGQILHHVTASCKGPIAILFTRLESQDSLSTRMLEFSMWAQSYFSCNNKY